MPDIRVSFQGGGAYLAKMIPMAHGISNVEASGAVRVEGVAGASAGSICAALLASKCDFDALRKTMKQSLEADAKKLAGAYYGPLSAVTIASTIAKILGGKDLVDRQSLATFVQTLLKHAPHVYPDISAYHKNQHTPNLFIARAKLTPDYLEVSEQGELISSVIDSCSIPFALKGFKAVREQAYIDGGLCENLPVKCFDPEDDVPLFAVSVSETSGATNDNIGILGYLLKIFSMTTGYSVARSREIIGSSFCLDESADFGFHQVSHAVEWFLDDDKYDSVRLRHEAKLRGFAELYRLATAGQQFLGGKNTLAKRNRDMKVLTQTIDVSGAWDIEASSMIVTAHSASLGSGKSDIIQLVSKVTAKRAAPVAYKGHVLLAGAELHQTSWLVRNLTKDRLVPFHAVHFQDPDDGGISVDPCYLVFDDPQRDIEEGDLIEIRAVMPNLPGADMSQLATDTDFVTFTNHHNDAASLSIILRYPVNLAEVFAQKRSVNSHEFQDMDEEALRELLPGDDVEFGIVGVSSRAEVRQGEFLSVNFVRAASCV
ncbi:MAG: patatin-like phospholipase family protein [Pseudomonadota bacterium]